MGLDIVWKNDALALPKVVAKVSLKKIYKMESKRQVYIMIQEMSMSMTIRDGIHRSYNIGETLVEFGVLTLGLY